MTDLSNVKILLAEDNPINMLMAKKLLQSRHILVDVVKNGNEAIEMLEKNEYQLILMDIQMPVMDGLQATKLIRANRTNSKGDIPIIAMTAEITDDTISSFKEAGMNGWLEKPLQEDVCFLTIASFTNR